VELVSSDDGGLLMPDPGGPMTANEDDGTIDAECEWDGGGYHALATVEDGALTLLISHDGGYEWESGCALRSRTSIGPDSERIRELEAEVERLRHLAQWVADTYTDEGRDDWWKSWDNADPQKRHRMYVGLAGAQ
jgi:hypothetical protein